MPTSKNGDKKRFFLVAITIQTGQRLKSYLANTYKTVERGMLHNEAEQAILYWLNMHTSAQENLDLPPVNPTPKVARQFAEVKAWMSHNLAYDLSVPGRLLLVTHIEQAVGEVFGHDPRTLRSHIASFMRFGLIKPHDYKHFELL